MQLGRLVVVLMVGAALAAASLLARVFVPKQLDAVRAPLSDQSYGIAEVALRTSVYVLRETPRVMTDRIDPLGRPVTVSCASCHANLEPNRARSSGSTPPMAFHAGLTFEHGALTCVTCHNSDNYNTLRLADGSALDYSDSIVLCSQCHAPQARDYAHGAHGGMTGYWDATRGPQERKSCVDCHDPHAPRFPTMQPSFKPIDRFLSPASHD